ncbi:MAG TPA: ABC transporter permease [Candidatus Polarisedimenticolia bacterium]|nr:ABC transporter permease [Candidatus Polarisedimenticolia bacterium]
MTATTGTFEELWQFRELFYFLAWRDIKVRYKQTALGVVWAILQPLLTMIIFSLLFGRIAKLAPEGVPGPVFYFSGLLPWLYFTTTLTLAGNSMVQNTNLVTKVYFPRIILPASVAASSLLDFLVGSTLLVGLIAWYKLAIGPAILLWPLLIFLLVLFTLGVSFILAALNVQFRDVKYAIPFFIQLWMFGTPIIYPVSRIPEDWRWLLTLNPMTGIVEAFRYAIVPAGVFPARTLSVSIASSFLVFAVGFYWFRRTERVFADIV